MASKNNIVFWPVKVRQVLFSSRVVTNECLQWGFECISPRALHSFRVLQLQPYLKINIFYNSFNYNPYIVNILQKRYKIK